VIPQSCSQFLNLRDRLGRRTAKELGNENPMRDGVLLVLALPSSVFGPVECWAFLRFVLDLTGRRRFGWLFRFFHGHARCISKSKVVLDCIG
jgi:hypothetical protein